MTPSDVKFALLGKRSGSKDEIMARVQELWPDMEWPDTKTAFEHVADAMGALQAVRFDGLYKRWASE